MISANEIKNHAFCPSAEGYHKAEVRSFLRALATQHENADSRISELESELVDTRDRLAAALGEIKLLNELAQLQEAAQQDQADQHTQTQIGPLRDSGNVESLQKTIAAMPAVPTIKLSDPAQPAVQVVLPDSFDAQSGPLGTYSRTDAAGASSAEVGPVTNSVITDETEAVQAPTTAVGASPDTASVALTAEIVDSLAATAAEQRDLLRHLDHVVTRLNSTAAALEASAPVIPDQAALATPLVEVPSPIAAQTQATTRNPAGNSKQLLINEDELITDHANDLLDNVMNDIMGDFN